jgi:bifunctional non-homologous end joining protein LigD
VASLREYRRKRCFDSSPEPRGSARHRPANRFVVQEHHARRLHYDFRLEVEGVLKSWAVPKGPSLNPVHKRLAIQTEDHPLEYRMFEGTIPRGQYGAGQITIWDEGTFEPEGPLSASEQIHRGELKFFLHGRRLRGSFVLVKMRGKDGKEWLLIKHDDEAARRDWSIDQNSAPSHLNRDEHTLAEPALPSRARKATMPARIHPALASPGGRPFSSPEWLFEIKWDGVRTLAQLREGKIRLWSRSHRDITREYPEMAELPQHVDAREAWLDGEIVVLDSQGRSDFERLQQRFSVRMPSAELLQSVPAVYYVFDVLYFNGYDLRAAPLLERKEFLKRILCPDSRFRYSDHVLEKGQELYDLALARKLEGLVAKKISSSYPEGRSSAWIKIKLEQDLDAVVGGWTSPRGSREHFGALLVGLYGGGELEFIGGVGTGFTGESQERIWHQLQTLKTSSCPFASVPVTKEKACWVRPELVARVEFASWTDARHLRAPRFLGLRDDRDPKACTFEDEMCASLPVPESRAMVKSLPAHPSAASRESVLNSDRKIEHELTRGTADNVFAELDAQRLHLTNLNKVYFPQDGYTKRDLLAYYFRIAPFILPFLKDRPLVLRRYPNGIEAKAFFQKDAGKDTPPWVKTVAIHSEDKNKFIHYIVANDRATLLYLTNLGCIDQNPWSSRYDDPDHPDYVFFDLDPTAGTPFSVVVHLAKSILATLQKLGMTAFAKTSGATGVHIYLPIEPRYTFEQTRLFVQAVASMVSREHPGIVTPERTVHKRPKGTIYVDAHQNSRGQSLASVYSVRAFPRAPVSAPVKALELNDSLEPEKWNIRSMARRLEKTGDLWAGFWQQRQKLESLLQ